MKGLCLNVDNAVILLVGARFARPKNSLFVSSLPVSMGSTLADVAIFLRYMLSYGQYHSNNPANLVRGLLLQP